MAEQLTAFEKEQAKCAKKINEYKLSSEANVVASIYKNPELIYNVDIKLEDFSHNIWKVYYAIAHGILITEKKTSLDELTFNFYLDKHAKLKARITEYGGYDTIKSATAYINTNNFESYMAELQKYNVLLELLKYGFPIGEDRLSEYVDKSAEEIYDELEMLLNHTFVNTESSVESCNIFDGMDEYIESLDKCADVGMPLYGSTILNNELGGLHRGHIMGIGAGTSVGKSWLAFQYVIPSAIKYGERVVVLCNEESERRWRTELLVFVINHVFNHNIQKHQLRNGEFSEEVWGWLHEAADWIKEKADQHLVTVVAIQRYNVEIAIKLIKKYSSAFNCKYFILDTLKESNNAKTDDIFKSMTRDTVELYNLIKESNKNLSLVVTYQLNKNANKVRHLTNLEVGQSKSILDVFSSNILVRRPNMDEYEGEKNQITGYRIEGKTKIPFTLNKDEKYFLIFISKNRHGVTDSFQIIARIDQGTNDYEEIGICKILEDW